MEDGVVGKPGVCVPLHATSVLAEEEELVILQPRSLGDCIAQQMDLRILNLKHARHYCAKVRILWYTNSLIIDYTHYKSLN